MAQPVLQAVPPQVGEDLRARALLAERAGVAKVYREVGKIEAAIEKIDAAFGNAPADPRLKQLHTGAAQAWGKMKADAVSRIAKLDESLAQPTFDAAAAAKSVADLKQGIDAMSATTSALTGLQQANQPITGLRQDGLNDLLFADHRFNQEMLDLLGKPDELQALLQKINPALKIPDSQQQRMNEVAGVAQMLIPQIGDMPVLPSMGYWGDYRSISDLYYQMHAVNLLKEFRSDPEKLGKFFDALGGPKLRDIKRKPEQTWMQAFQEAAIKHSEAIKSGNAPGVSTPVPANPNPRRIPGD